jgi:alkylation response protein AidB-like acyl-CoA dehydrogenase
MEARRTAKEEALIKIAGDFAREHVAPHAARWELERTVPAKTIAAAAKVGLAGVLVPVEAGGQGASHVAAAEVLERLASHCMAFAFALWVHNNVANGIARAGNEEQRRRYVPAMLRGERIGAFCLTEPGVGSDATAITTTASRVGAGWELNGEKAWVTNGVCADVFTVYAQTDANLGWRGIACFLVDGDAPSLKRGPAYTMMGGHAMGIAGLALDRCRVPAANLLLGPGDGFKAAMQGINMARTFVGAACCGILEAGLKAALDYGAKRRAFGQPILAFQGLQWKLADVATDLEAARLLTRKAALALDCGEKAIVEAAHAKKFATRVTLSGIARCMGAMGAAGYRTESPLARHLANAQLTEYLDGTTEIQNIVISRALLKPYGIDAR